MTPEPAPALPVPAPAGAGDPDFLRGTVNGLTVAVEGLAWQLGSVDVLKGRVDYLDREIHAQLAELLAKMKRWYPVPPEPRRGLKAITGGGRCSAPVSGHLRLVDQ